jgi:hypothetical protein
MSSEPPGLIDMSVEQVRWPIVDWCLGILGVRLAAIAAASHLTVSSWEEDGLGPAVGVGARLPSGVVFVLVELAHQIKHHHFTGPAVYVDIGDALTFGTDHLLAEITKALNLMPADIVARYSPPTAAEVATFR